MSRSRTPSSNRRQRRATLAEMPFRELIEENEELKKLREQYSDVPAEQRRKAAQWAYDSAQATTLMSQAVNDADWVDPKWEDLAAPLAIDPEYAPAMLTVGSLEYQYGRVEESMKLFLKLTTLPANTEDLEEIIDKGNGANFWQESAPKTIRASAGHSR